METALYFRHRSLASSPLLFAPYVSNSSKSKPHVSFRSSSLSFTSGCMWRSLRHMHRPITCAINKFPMPRRNNGNDDNKLAITLPATVALACVLGFMCSNCMMYPKAIAAAPNDAARQIQIGCADCEKTEHNYGMAKKALRSLFNARRVPAYVAPERPDIPAMKTLAVCLANYGLGDEAVIMLKKEYDANKRFPESAYEIELLLVEILIRQGKYEEASKHIDAIEKEEYVHKSDLRFPLYKAIVLTMLDKDEAKKAWDAFSDSLEEDGLPDPNSDED